MTTTTETRPTVRPTHRVPFPVRGAQALLLIPLGALQFVAAIVFSITLGFDNAFDACVATWAVLMAGSNVALALRFARPEKRILQIALALLALEAGFSTVKLTVYHESASLVFYSFVALAAGLLVHPSARRHFGV